MITEITECDRCDDGSCVFCRAFNRDESAYQQGYADAEHDIQSQRWTRHQAREYLETVCPMDDDEYDQGHREAIARFAGVPLT